MGTLDRGIELFEKTLNTDEELIIKKLEQWAKEIPYKNFIYYGEENEYYTFEQFNSMVNSFANQLIDKGIKKGDRIALFLKNPLITTLSMFGIWKAGAVFCPVNFNYKGKLLSYQLNDLSPSMLITEEEMIPIFNEISMEISSLKLVIYRPDNGNRSHNKSVALNNKFRTFPFWEFLKGEQSNPNLEINFYDTANIIYTSGTTGNAKGVVQSFRWLHGYTYFLRAFNTQEDIVYNDLPLYHTGGAIANISRAAFIGCTVAIWDKFSPNEFWDRIKLSGASNAILLDVMIPWLMKESPNENDVNNTLNRVHMQPLPKYHHRFAKRFGIDFVSAAYSQTESGNGTVAIFNQLKDSLGTPLNLYKGYSKKKTAEIANGYNIPYLVGSEPVSQGFMGVQTPYTEIEILNENDELQEANKVGQIALRSKYPFLLLKEYYNNPAATAKATQNLWFHTGDAGYKDENGRYYFVDRMNDVIRQKGENISSYQVEDIINQNNDVLACSVFPITAEEGEEDDIVAYIVAKTTKLTEKELRAWLENTAPKFMIPKYIRFISELPRTQTNKIEKFKLKEKFIKEIKI